MTYKEKSEIVIRQLREDRDRLLDAIDNIRAEIASLDTIMLNDNPKKVSAYVKLSDVREVIDKYR